ncbi:2-oxoglutarate and iron-dependent oxygenase domain-containing protein, partial [Flavobacteriaceae bacterium]|nr:2-oxoglutarate and iron-dependent oxygenase domain-containing protein [Flavobacteriaceae bacterium]
MNKIPSVNLADFLSNDISKKQQFINDIGHAYENIGFVALKGHFLDDLL